MRKIVAVAAVVVFAIGLYWFLHSQKEPSVIADDSSAPTATSAAHSALSPGKRSATAPAIAAQGTPNAPAGESTSLAARAGAVPAPAAAPNLPAAVLLNSVSHSIHQYRAAFGGNPVGTNAEITDALNGHNPKQINFIDPQAGVRISDQGELLDAWGTPLFFHQLSGTDMEVRSAGVDKKMWTVDDLVAR